MQRRLCRREILKAAGPAKPRRSRKKHPEEDQSCRRGWRDVLRPPVGGRSLDIEWASLMPRREPTSRVGASLTASVEVQTRPDRLPVRREAPGRRARRRPWFGLIGDFRSTGRKHSAACARSCSARRRRDRAQRLRARAGCARRSGSSTSTAGGAALAKERRSRPRLLGTSYRHGLL